jgi:hypothetical protein
MNGLAVDAGLTVIWTLFKAMQEADGWMDEGDASMLIEVSECFVCGPPPFSQPKHAKIIN